MPSWTPYLLYPLFAIALAILIFGIIRKGKLWKKGQKGEGPSFGKGIKRVIYDAIFQGKILRDLYPGLMHTLIFVGFVILFIGTTLVFIEQDFLSFFNVKILKGNFYLVFEILLDLFGLYFVVGIGLAIFRRIVIQPAKLENKLGDLYVLGLLLLIGLGGFGLEAMRIAKTQPEYAQWSFVGYFISKLLAGKDISEARYITFWWAHAVFTFIFIGSIPFTKFFHILTAPTQIFNASQKPRGELATPFDIEKKMEESDEFNLGAKKTEDYKVVERISFDACTQCGRCHHVCPAASTEKPLSPRSVVLDLKDQMQKGQEIKIDNEALWACTTCSACMEECPVHISHIDLIVEMRRHQVMMEGKLEPGLDNLFKGVENNSNPWNLGFNSRADWAQDLNIKKASDKDFEYIYFVGCAGSFDDRNKKVAKAFVKILGSAEIRFAILGTEEKCCGDSIRRAGNEFLAQTLMKENIANLSKYDVKKIITTCPHCYNTLKNEYPKFGGNYRVLHHTEILNDLLKSKRINLENKSQKFAFHDSCYLGRYNNIYNEPRNILHNLGQLIEPQKSKDRSFCCGAGGSRMWLEETIGKRINEERLDQFIKKDTPNIITSCPYCLTMLSDAAKNKGIEEKIKVADIVEVI